jgi:hypothetical protein
MNAAVVVTVSVSVSVKNAVAVVVRVTTLISVAVPTMDSTKSSGPATWGCASFSPRQYPKPVWHPA